jgi:hypothetical protein
MSSGLSSVTLLESGGSDLLFPENMFDSDEIRRVKRLELDAVVGGSLRIDAEVDVLLIFGLGIASCVFPESFVVAARDSGRSIKVSVNEAGIGSVDGSTNVADDDDDGSSSCIK